MTSRDEFLCHWTHEHGPHPWLPMIEDPEAPGVFYLDASGMVACPGKPAPT